MPAFPVNLGDRTVVAADLVFLDFSTTPKRVHTGFGSLLAGGYTWDGIGELGSISAIENPVGASAPQTTFTLSGVSPDLIAATLATSAEVKGREVQVFRAFFDRNLRAVGSPYMVYRGLMDVMKINATGPGERSITVTAEQPWIRRGIPAFAYLTDRDQQALYPGDTGLMWIPRIVNVTVTFPYT